MSQKQSETAARLRLVIAFQRRKTCRSATTGSFPAKASGPAETVVYNPPDSMAATCFGARWPVEEPASWDR